MSVLESVTRGKKEKYKLRLDVSHVGILLRVYVWVWEEDREAIERESVQWDQGEC